MSNSYKCLFCGNTDPKYIGYLNGKPYCRYCIKFRGETVEEDENQKNSSGEIFISYDLSKQQKEISAKILNNYIENKNTLVYAVCGAGKTELVFEVISYCLKNGFRIGFAIPRRDVVIELEKRLKSTFKNENVISIYGGHHEILRGQIAVLTTHQLYRYPNFFDLLILDEIDAFPYANNKLLMSMFAKSVKGNYILLSATPSKEYIEDFKKSGEVVCLYTRFHKHPLPVPEVIKLTGFRKYLRTAAILKEFVNEKKPVLVFVPTIDQCYNLYRFLNSIIKNGNYVSSKSEDRSQIINDFRNKKYAYLVTTSVLERGVTLDNLQVIVFNAEHNLFDCATLVQISGRVGRKFNHPDGEVKFITRKSNIEIEKCIETIKEANKHL